VELTRELAARFRGGQIEVQNQGHGSIWHGLIKTIGVEGTGDEALLSVTLEWAAAGDKLPVPNTWTAIERREFGASLMMYRVDNMGRGANGGDRLWLHSTVVGEAIILYPPGSSTFDPSRVIGLSVEPR